MDSVTLEYDLMTLPTAQHKAGLAGLVLSIQEMNDPSRHRGDDGLDRDADVPELKWLSDTSVEITLTENSCQMLFDDCYRAIMGEVEVEKAWKNVEVLRTGEKEKKVLGADKTKIVKTFVHPNLEPRNPFLARYLFRELKDSKKDLWYKLWRDMLFQIPRAIPATRNPYKQTVGGSCKEGAEMWKELVKFAKDRDDEKFRVTKLSSALLLGAQDSTAENVGFLERVDNVLALNFWPLTTVIYVPFLLELDAANPKRSRMEAAGFSLAIPEVSNLKLFCSCFPRVLEKLRTDAKPQGYRPRNACVEVAGEASLDLLSQQAWLASEKVKEVSLAGVISAVEYIHLKKRRNNVKTLASGRVSPDPKLLRRYDQIRSQYFSPLFRSIRLAGIFDRTSKRWWESFAKPLNTLPVEFFINTPDIPYFVKYFQRDVLVAFSQEDNQELLKKETDMSQQTDSPPPAKAKEAKSIERIIMNMVRSYILQKTADKTGVNYETIKAEFKSSSSQNDQADEKPRSPERNKFEDARKKLGMRLFLEVRSRHGSDFASYFAEHFGAVQQYTIASGNDFQKVCDALLKSPEDVRVITLLALSANS